MAKYVHVQERESQIKDTLERPWSNGQGSKSQVSVVHIRSQISMKPVTPAMINNLFPTSHEYHFQLNTLIILTSLDNHLLFSRRKFLSLIRLHI